MKNHKKFWLGIGTLAAILLGGLFLLAPAHKAQAANVYVTSQQQIESGIGTLHFVNRFEIDGTFNGQVIKFIDKGPSDTDFNYKPTDGFCSTGGTVSGITIDGSQLAFENLGNYLDIPATVDLDYASAPTQGAKCNDTNPNKISSLNGSPVDIGQPDNASIMFNWNSDGTIARSDGAGGWTFRAAASGSTIYRSDSNKCAKALILRSGNQSGTVYDLTQTPGGPDASSFSDLSGIFSSGTCYVKSVNVYDQDASKFQALSQDSFTISGTPPDDAGSCTNNCPPGGGGGGGSVQKGGACNAGKDCVKGVCQKDNGDCQNDSCAQLSASPFSWFLCPGLDIAEKFSNWLLQVFESELSFKVSDLNGGANCQVNQANTCQEKVKRAWSVIRDLSSAMVVIVMLIMVISQAISWGPFDAYTIKKMLPRLIIVVILMQMSWDLFSWVVNLVDAIGNSVANLMYYPFGGSANLDLGSLLANANIGNTGGSSLTWGLLSILGAMVGTILAVAALPSLVFFVITAIFSLLTGFVTLMFRKILIIMCLVFAPLALLAWILPGTQTYFKLWRENFTKALMMFPLVIAIVASGRIFAYIAGTQQTGPGSVVLNFVIIMVGYFAPLFILPKTFKWGGSLMNTVGGTVQGMFKPAGEKVGKFGREWADRWQGERANKLDYNPRTGRFAGTKRLASIGLRRVQSGHILPTARDRKLAIQKGDKWSAEEDEIGAAYANRVYGRALENGYQDRNEDGSLKFEVNDDGSFKLDANGNKIPVMLTGTAAAKQALVDIAHHEDRKIAKGAIGRLIKTASWPEVQSSVDAEGRRVYEDNPHWGNTISKDESLYPAVLKSRVDTAPHIVYSAEQKSLSQAEMSKALGKMGITDAAEQTAIINDPKKFKALYQMHYALTEQMSNEDFATQSEGFWEEAAVLANEAGGGAIRGALASRLEAIQGTGAAGQQVLGHLAGGSIQQKVDSVLSGAQIDPESGKPNVKRPNVPGAVNQYIARAVGPTGGGTPPAAPEGTIPTEGVDIPHDAGGGDAT